MVAGHFLTNVPNSTTSSSAINHCYLSVMSHSLPCDVPFPQEQQQHFPSRGVKPKVPAP